MRFVFLVNFAWGIENFRVIDKGFPDDRRISLRAKKLLSGGCMMSKILFGYSSACCFYDEEDFRAEFKVTDRGNLILRVFDKGGRCE